MDSLPSRSFLRRIAGRCPIQIRNFIRRTQLRGGIPVAIQAESHAQGLVMINFIHLIDLPVAFDATDPPIHMDRMIEIDVIGGAMDLNPWNRLAAGSAIPYQREPRI